MLLYKPRNRPVRFKMEIEKESSSQTPLFQQIGAPLVKHQVSTPTTKLSQLVEETLEVKTNTKNNIETERKSFWKKYKINDLDSDFWLVGGDFFSMGYLSFEAAQSFSPALKTVSLLQTLSTIFGVVGGVINIAVGISCIAQGVKKLNKGQKLDGARLLFDGILMILIGALMIAGPLLLKFAAGAAITAVLTNPIILPILFALLSVFITYEVLKKILPMWAGTDLGTQVIKKLDQVINDNEQTIGLLNLILPKTVKIEGEDGKELELDVNLETLKGWIQEGKEKQVQKVLCETMNRIEENVGVESALEMFQLMQSLLGLLEAQETEMTLMDESALLESQATLLNSLANESVSEIIKQVGIEEPEQLVEQVTERIKEKIEKEHQSPSLQEKTIIPIKQAPIQDKLIKQVAQAKLEQASKIRKIYEQKPELQKQVRKWKIIQHVRLAQQVLYIGASIATFGTFSPGANVNLINGVVNTSMALANFIPLLLDKLETTKFYRNVPVDVPGVTLKALATNRIFKALNKSHMSPYFNGLKGDQRVI